MTARPLRRDRVRPAAGCAVGGRSVTRGDRGSAAVEFAVAVPALVLLVGLVVGGARVWLARTTVDQMAAAAARGASLARSPADARHDGRALAEAQAATDGLRCRSLTVTVDTAGLASAPGRSAEVQASVRCAIGLADVLVPGWPGEITVSAEAGSVIDRYRGRS